MKTIYFQPKNINPKYCEVGVILNTDPYYIHYLEYPCKVLITDVKIIDESRVVFDEKSRLFLIK